jgi:DNA (cytosine-5)-methyltransferase 1
MMTLPSRILSGKAEAPDVLVGGTPCQPFSVAGLRKGLSDPRGQLTRTFVEILDAIDTVRHAAGRAPCTALWENVPGVLSDKDNAFGNFLGALVGEDCALEPSGGRWTDAGLVLGPTRQAAWRILDAQYFGVAQRRRRVFVVVSSRASDVRPIEVLLIEQGVRRDTPPSREARQGAPAPARPGAAPGSQHGDAGGRWGGVAQTYPELVDVVGALSDGAHNGGGSTGRTPTRAASSLSAHYPELPEVAGCLVQRDAKGADSDTKPGHVIPMRADGGFFDPIAFDARQTDVCVYGDKSGPLDTDPGTIGVCVTGDRTHSLTTRSAAEEDGAGRGTPIVPSGMSVRRLTPTECERLQGFPDDYTRIPWKKKRGADECPDGPRYKALGNSMAVPVIRWIGDRIDRAVAEAARLGVRTKDDTEA